VPGPVRAAGIIWIVLGTFDLLLRFVRYSLQTAQEWAQHPSAASPAADPVQAVANGLGLLLGIGCLVAGVRVLSGSARGTVLASVLSILVGMLYLGVAGAVILVLVLQAPPHALLFIAVVAGVLGPISGGFLLAGSLGLAGRSQYLAWRAANQRRQPPARQPRLVEYADDLRRWGETPTQRLASRSWN
jgi:hypothetical protein